MQPSIPGTCRRAQSLFLQQFGRSSTRTIVLGIMICAICVAVVYSEEGKAELPRVIPRPRIEEYGQNSLPVAGNGKAVSIRISHPEKGQAKQIEEGLVLLSRRLGLLGGAKVEVLGASESHQILVERCSDQKMSEILQMEGIREEVDGKRLAQAYYLRVQQSHDRSPIVTIRACSDLGLYYGLVSLCQLLDRNKTGQPWLPEVKIVDWPEIGCRLAKVSASESPLDSLELLSQWLPMYKINQMGLQFHGKEAKKAAGYVVNTRTICAQTRKRETLQAIPYFCPFRGGGYDFSLSGDQEEYLEMLRGFMDAGAYGIQIDYNDWGNTTRVPIEDVLNSVCRGLVPRHPEAIVLWCPPQRGAARYRGPATDEMARILANVPGTIWPLWVGLDRNEKILQSETVRAWTDKAGRKPFCWVIGVSATDICSRPVEGLPNARVFRGERMPKNLHELFEGVHLNVNVPRPDFVSMARGYLPPVSEFTASGLAYLATAADCLWNPHDWNDVESWQRATRFVEIMQPLVSERSALTNPKNGGINHEK